MEIYFYWLAAGFVLVIAELMTGTFFLLVLGVAAFFAALAAFVGLDFWIQAAVAAVVTVAGMIFISKRKFGAPDKTRASMDAGQAVIFESWVSEANGLARVNYRGSTWDAVIIGERATGDHPVYFILGADGSTLRVAISKPQ